ncbi:MAG: hypothetical protein JWL71_4387 [Acidobacteria bacterium]|nr:hypothetical protein [Acidobacteriota bacterium]
MKRAAAFATLLLLALAAGDRLNPVRTGLNGAYYANATWSNPAVVTTRDPQPTDARVRAAWRDTPPPQFSVAWSGSFLAMHDGPYALATVSDDGSVVYVDGQAVVDNSGARVWPRGATGVVTLTRGVHAIHVRYAQEGGAFHFELLWARAGEPLEPVPAWAMTPRRVSFAAFAFSAGLRQTLAAAEWLWVAVLVVWALRVVWSVIAREKAWLEREQVWPAMRWILGASLVLNLAGIWWGLPGGSWAADELSPVQVLGAAAQHFGHGWFDRYPPLHYYILTAAFSPLLVLEKFGRVDLSTTAPYAVLAFVGRLVSVAAAAGILLAAYACGARAFSRRAGLFAAAMMSVVTPFVYYAKTANLDVPYLFWFALALVFYLRVLDNLALRDFLGFAACATLSICTKDQAYGLFLPAPFAFVYRLWQVNRATGTRRPLARALFDARLWWAAAVAVVLFAAGHNVMFNASGFVEHVRFITGPASVSYRDFEATLAGRMALLRLSIDIVRMAWGWPMFLVAVAGVVLAVQTPAHRRAALWLALPAVSYYASFVNVVLYNYDRFMLPVCLILSVFGGFAFDWWLSDDRRGRPWRAAVAGGVFACTMLYAATVDLVMIRDSRYTVEQWLAGHVARTETVAYVFPLQYYPRIERFNNAGIVNIAQLKEAQPSYYVLNADYARAEPPRTETGQLIAGLQNGDLGYVLVFRYREPVPWPWLPGAPRDLVGDRNERPITSVLRHINPWYEVFKRGG